jgi:hypothetical protein
MKPRANFVILNANAAFSMEDQSGVILHDGHGSFIAVRSIFISHVTSATMAEAVGMLNGLAFANYLGCNVVEVKSDLSKVIHYCTGDAKISNEATATYVDILTQADIGKVEFKHCGRETNTAAH